MATVKTSRVVAIMLAGSLIITTLMAILKLSAFFLTAFLVPALTAAYYQRKHGVQFDKPQRKSISRWYVGIGTAIGLVPLAMLVNETKDKLNEPLSPILVALVLGVVILMLIAYFVIYWLMGMNYTSKDVHT